MVKTFVRIQDTFQANDFTLNYLHYSFSLLDLTNWVKIINFNNLIL